VFPEGHIYKRWAFISHLIIEDGVLKDREVAGYRQTYTLPELIASDEIKEAIRDALAKKNIQLWTHISGKAAVVLCQHNNWWVKVENIILLDGSLQHEMMAWD
jgi:hypothetical protein